MLYIINKDIYMNTRNLKNFFIFKSMLVAYCCTANAMESKEDPYDHVSTYKMICSIKTPLNAEVLPTTGNTMHDEVRTQIITLIDQMPLLLRAARDDLECLKLQNFQGVIADIFGEEFNESKKFPFFKNFFGYMSMSAIESGMLVLENNKLLNRQDRELFIRIGYAYNNFLKAKYPVTNSPSCFDIQSEDVSLFSKQLNSLALKPEDVIISVGNTPSWLLKSLQLAYTQQQRAFPYTVLYVGISSHPNSLKHTSYWCKDIATESGLANYRQYLRDIGFLNQHTGNLHFIDIMDTAGAVSFLFEELINYSNKMSTKLPQINIIALNNDTRYEKLNPLKSFINSYANLDLKRLQKLDQCPDDIRFIPKMPAYLWDDSSIFNYAKDIPCTERGQELWTKMNNDLIFSDVDIFSVYSDGVLKTIQSK